MDQEKKKSSLEKRQEELYSRSYKPQENNRGDLGRDTISHTAWQESPQDHIQQSVASKEEKPKMSFYKKFILGAIGFFVISLIVAGISFFSGLHSFSSTNVDISISSPVSVKSGDELPIDITITNNNDTDIVDVAVTVVLPEGVYVQEGESLSRYEEKIDFIEARSFKKVTLRPFLYGEKDSTKTVSAFVEYTIEGASTRFDEEDRHDIVINAGSVVVTNTIPPDITANQNIEAIITVASNSNKDIKNLLLSISYPFGFEFTDADPAPRYDDRVWVIENIEPKKEVEIKISGIMTGQYNEERTFGLSTGFADESGRAIESTLASEDKTVILRPPVVDIASTINGQTANTAVINMGDRVRVDVEYLNGSSDTIRNARIQTTLSGIVLDKSSVTVSDDGRYRSFDDVIVWDSINTSKLANISPGDHGTLSFSFSTVADNDSARSSYRNPEIAINTVFEGTRQTSSQSNQISSTIQKKALIQTKAELKAQSLYSIGPFQNVGPMPPKAEELTSYTISLGLQNAYNNISEAFVVAELPSTVSWGNAVEPSGAITYDPNTRRVSWQVGTIRAGAGYSLAEETASFKVLLQPSLADVGDIPILIRNIVFTGIDDFTGEPVAKTVDRIDTRIVNDPIYYNGIERVEQ